MLCQLLEVGERGLDGCVTAHWIQNCSVLWVANFFNTSSTEKCTMGIRTVVQLQTIFHLGEAEVQSSIGILWRWTVQLCLCLWSGIVGGFYFVVFRENVYVLTPPWKCEGVGQTHHGLIYIYCFDFFSTIKQVPTDYPWMLYSSNQFIIWVGGGVHLFSFLTIS